MVQLLSMAKMVVVDNWERISDLDVLRGYTVPPEEGIDLKTALRDRTQPVGYHYAREFGVSPYGRWYHETTSVNRLRFLEEVMEYYASVKII